MTNMDQSPLQLRELGLKLSEEQRKNVRALRRQISRPSTRNLVDENIDNDIVASLREDELQLLRDVVQSFKTYETVSAETIGDEVDGIRRKVRKGWSVDSNYPSSPEDGNFVNPARFYVRVTKEDVEALEQVCMELDKEEAAEKTNKNPFCNNTQPLLNGYENNHQSYGLRVAITRQSEKVVVVKNTLTSALPERFSKHDNFHSRKGIFSHNYTGLRSKHIPPKERFRQAVYLVINNLKMLPRRMEKDFSELWRKRGNVTWLSLAFTIGGIIAFFADIGTDLKVAADHFTQGQNYWWGSFTVMLVFFPSVVTNLVSFFWYKEDEKRLKNAPESGWVAVKWTHLCLIGIVERYWRVLVKAYRIKRKKTVRVIDFKLLIAMNLDLALLQMILAFTEDAPQLMLQMYVLVSRHAVEALDANRIQDLWTILSICFSFFSYSRATVNYISCLRDSKRHKGQLRWYGYLSIWSWRAFMIVSRILILVFFATEFKLWFFVAMSLHFVIVLFFLEHHEVYFFPDSKYKQQFFRVVMSYIHLFCFFCLEGSRTYKWAVKYYILGFIEIITFSILWFTNTTRLLPWQIEVAGFVVIYMFFALGLLMMTTYYRFLHPRFKRARFSLLAPLKSELADTEHADNDSSKKFDFWI
ncbi:XK-related protein 6-like [Montipora capricornis]|uniref:XK-related protein 6-like n=1 Tax=Montipora capricornis TaxID=246305 RepID=UPI0035F1C0CE